MVSIALIAKGPFSTLDYRDLKKNNIASMESSFPERRKDKETLNQMEIFCPKCSVPMKKYKKAHKKDLILDICPSCKGIWFDQGEIERFRKAKIYASHDPKAMQVKLICSQCSIEVEADNVHSAKDIQKCPRCNEYLSLKGVGEVLVPKFPMKHKMFLISFFGGMPLLYVLCRPIFRSVGETVLVVGTVGMVWLFIILRAIIYNKFAFASGCPGVVRDFDLSPKD